MRVFCLSPGADMPVTLDEYERAFSDAANLQGMQGAGEAYLQGMWVRARNQGDGDWPPLSEYTPANRRARPFSRSPILSDSGSLIEALLPGAPGHLVEPSTEGCLVGFSNDPHPTATEEGADSYALLARRHALGQGNLPIRTILVEPVGPVLESIVAGANTRINSVLSTL